MHWTLCGLSLSILCILNFHTINHTITHSTLALHWCSADIYRNLSIISIHIYSLLLLKSVCRFLSQVFSVSWKPRVLFLLRFNWLVTTWWRIWVWEIWKQITKVSLICRNHYIEFFREVAPLFRVSFLRKSCS